MIVNKQNLMVVHTSKADKNIPALDTIFIERDGTTVGCGGKTLVLVSPVKEEIKEKLTESEILKDSSSAPMALPSSTVKTIIKDLPADKQFKGLLEHCNIKRKNNICKVELTDGQRKRLFEGKVYPRDWLPYQKLISPALERIASKDKEEKGQQIVLNKKRLLHLLDCINKIAPDSSDDDPLYVSFTKEGDIVLRGKNYKTGQSFIACMWAYKGGEGQWLELNEWEEKYVKRKDVSEVDNTKRKITRSGSMVNRSHVKNNNSSSEKFIKNGKGNKQVFKKRKKTWIKRKVK